MKDNRFVVERKLEKRRTPKRENGFRLSIAWTAPEHRRGVVSGIYGRGPVALSDEFVIDLLLENGDKI